MKLKKVYANDKERKADQRRGIILCLLMNVCVWLLDYLYRLDLMRLVGPEWSVWVQAFPWLANGVVWLLACIFRPHIAYGFVLCIGATFAFVFAMGAVFIGSCFIAVALTFAIGEFAVYLWLIAMIGGGLFVLIKSLNFVVKWWNE